MNAKAYNNTMSKMGFRTADESSFTFKTDLPPANRNIHPSGVVHAFRTDTANGREEHAFAWINNVLYVESAIAHFEKFGFDRTSDILFLPYSTKKNWLNRYPHAAPALECGEDGDVTVYLNWRPYPNGLGEMGSQAGNDPSSAEGTKPASVEGVGADVAEAKEKAHEKKRKARGATNMLQDGALLPDAERDELHVEIWKYLGWLHAKLDRLEKKAAYAKAAKAAAAAGDIAMEAGADPNDEEEQKGKRGRPKRVNLDELQAALDKIEAAFLVIPNAKLEAEEAAALATEEGGAKEPEVEPPKRGRPKKGAPPRKTGAPFLEEALTPALGKLVEAREVAGKKRRKSGRVRTGWQLGSEAQPKNPAKHGGGEDFDEMLERLRQYKEQFGDCNVNKNYTEDVQLGRWVRGLRERRVNLRKKGIEVEEYPKEGKPLLPRTLIADRIERLDNIGFQWTLAPPKVSWEDRFTECTEYFYANGRWPSQSGQGLGCWVHKQRQAFSRKDKKFMLNKAPRLDEVGFEWTPRGNTKISWDEGYEKLVEFGRINGHFDVPKPADGKSEERKFYNWVRSLHGMYRSYKLGRQSGSLNDERILMLVKQGFVFRND